MLLLALTVNYSAYLLLCIAMPKHYRQVSGGDVAAPLPKHLLRVSYRICGWFLLLLSFGLCVMAGGWQLGPVQWVGLLAAAGLLLVFLLPYKPKAAASLAVIAPVTAFSIHLVERFYL